MNFKNDFDKFRGTVVTKARLRVQFLLALGWERGKAEASSSALLSKKGVGREGSIDSQQKFDFFCSDIMPNGSLNRCVFYGPHCTVLPLVLHQALFSGSNSVVHDAKTLPWNLKGNLQNFPLVERHLSPKVGAKQVSKHFYNQHEITIQCVGERLQ